MLWKEHGVDNLTFEGRLVWIWKTVPLTKNNSPTFGEKPCYTKGKNMQTKFTGHERVAGKTIVWYQITQPTPKVKWSTPWRSAVLQARSVFHVARILSLYYKYWWIAGIFWYEHMTGIGTGKTETETDSALARNICFLIRSTPARRFEETLERESFPERE